jgi:hypothetical protein
MKEAAYVKRRSLPHTHRLSSFAIFRLVYGAKGIFIGDGKTMKILSAFECGTQCNEATR